MLFNSFQFLVFYVFTVVLFFAVPSRRQWLVLLAASYYFYLCWNPPYIIIIWVITLIDFAAGIRLERSSSPRHRTIWLLLSVLANVGVLFSFKYMGFLLNTVYSVLRPFNIVTNQPPQFAWLLPVGISFHTFQGISYTVDVYRRRVRAERHLGMYALYVAFFPQLVAGPIERPNNLLPQIHGRKRLEYARLRSGFEVILWGLFKKLIIADSLAVIVNHVYTSPRDYPGVLLLFGTVCFAIQVYADFSGYSDMAVGLARIMGYDLTVNFLTPYLAGSLGEFWRRWHISLSSWFRDYVYIPLGGSRTARLRWMFNIAVVFLLSGLWHGANWTFLVWGGIHGVFVILGRTLQPVRRTLLAWSGIERLPAVHRMLQTCTTTALVTFAWIFFRAKSLDDALYIASHVFNVGSFRIIDLLSLGLPAFELFITGLATLVLFAVEFGNSQGYLSLTRWWNTRPLRWAVYCAGFYSLVFFGVFNRIEFIYFQF